MFWVNVEVVDGTTEGENAVMLEELLAELGVLCFAAKLFSLAGMEFSRC